MTSDVGGTMGIMEHRLVGPAYARVAAYERQGGYCLACFGPMSPDLYEAHHRTRRRDLGWCTCNVVALHSRCHTQGAGAVHDHPADAHRRGLIVPSWDDPRDVPVETWWPWHAWVLLRCDGTLETHPTRPLP